MSLLSVQHVSKCFGDVIALENVNSTLALASFSRCWASGCGKTTLMRLVAGFETPDSARLHQGKDLSGVPPHKRPVNMMFQPYALFTHLDVF